MGLTLQANDDRVELEVIEFHGIELERASRSDDSC